ncbi:hypothetical protein [Blastococcus brunescens]|uniref:Uncharacterized protein n=1 Tax=Blastococcus brunescens TaxID=1564165 RepID=A0ABZ1AWM9_9ACTN|nr:hypothetical protein [Blastococcus sp. BMG 8361]WRL62522.1 hypothetical protein U6N30_21360 [Blastococcus sp. BMG 8361]
MPRPFAVLLTVAAAAAILSVQAPDASAAPTATVFPSTVRPGESFTVSGTGCWDPDFDPDVHFPYEWTASSGATVGGPGAVEMTAASGGAWSVTVQVPPSWHPGMFSVVPWCRISSGVIFDYPKMWVTVPPPVPAPAPVAPPSTAATAAPRTPSSTAPRTTAPDPSAAATTSATSTTAAVPVAPSAAPGCADCATLTGGAPVTAGQALTLAYAGFQPGEPIAVVMRSTPVELGTFIADAAGVVTAEITVPADAESGPHTLTFSGPVTGDHVVELRLAAAEVRELAAPSAPADEDRTLLLVLGGVGVVLVGAGAVVAVRRRSRSSHEAPADGAQATATPIAEPIA